MKFKPTIFIGSSSEGLKIAELVAEELQDFAEVKLWTLTFDIGRSNYDNLMSQISFYDYAILVATGDDTIESRGTKQAAPRDNVLFEFGMFAGGLGRSRVFFLTQKDTKIPSDLTGITLPFIPEIGAGTFNSELQKQITAIKQYIADRETIFVLNFLPSTALAYGYFVNFVERTVERLLNDKAKDKSFHLENGISFSIKKLKVTILIPDDLSDNMFSKVKAKRLREGWQKMKVDPEDVRDYDFSIDISSVSDGELHLVDIPYTLNALNKAIELYSSKSYIGKDAKEIVLETREIRNFQRTLQYLVDASSIARGIVNIEVVSI